MADDIPFVVTDKDTVDLEKNKLSPIQSRIDEAKAEWELTDEDTELLLSTITAGAHDALLGDDDLSEEE